MALKVSVLAGGRGKASPEQGLALNYLSKARDQGGNLGFEGFQISEADDRKLSAALASAPHPILLDEAGKAYSSVGFATWLARLRDQGLPALTFVIGAADGFTQADRAHGKAVLGFGPQTWPHLLVRPMLAEQLFRAMTILANHPYHRAGSQ